MLKIFINGESGKMGSSIIKLINDDDSFTKVEKEDFKTTDVVIDFSRPDSTLRILQDCIEYKKPLLIGTTGLNDTHIQELEIASEAIPILIASNMSKGIINLKKSLKNYISNNSEPMNCMIEEAHHTEKVDAPSGTALDLQKEISIIYPGANVSIESFREGKNPGEHTVRIGLHDEIIELKHKAENRSIFALGALKGASWLTEKTAGLYAMTDIYSS